MVPVFSKTYMDIVFMWEADGGLIKNPKAGKFTYCCFDLIDAD